MRCQILQKKHIKKIRIKVYDEKIPKSFGIRFCRVKGFKYPEYSPYDILRSAFIPSGKVFIRDESLSIENIEEIRKIWKKVRYLFRDFEMTEIVINLGFIKVTFKK